MAAFCAPHIGGIDANRTVKDEIVATISRRSVRRRIAVTDLINPRQKFFERAHPEIQPSPERQQAMLAGTGFHETFGRAVSTEEYVEQLVEWQEIVGKIDIFEDAPVELKTGAAIPTTVFWRPDHVEQLGMYCTMVDRPAGHLLYYVRAEYGRQAELAAFDLEFTDPTAIALEMVRRRDLLREALNSGRPDHLPRCTWYGRGCDFAEVCGCSSAEPLIRAVSPQTVRVAANPALARRLLEGLGRQPPAPELSLNDLVFPRKAAFRRAPGAEEEEPDAAQRMVSLQRQGFDQVLGDAVWYGFPGQVRRLPVVLGPVRASVLLFKEAPTVLRTSRWQRKMVERRWLAEVFPHYVDRLGFECALAGKARGRLIVYYAQVPGDKFMVYDIWFRDLAAIRTELERRIALLQRGAPPEELPPCRPAWLARFCAYRDRCGCAEPAG
jgi:hypothetical protein